MGRFLGNLFIAFFVVPAILASYVGDTVVKKQRSSEWGMLILIALLIAIVGAICTIIYPPAGLVFGILAMGAIVLFGIMK